jgi:hypothetical protein
LAAPNRVSTSSTNILSSLNSAFKIFCCTQTHTWLFRSQYLFSIYNCYDGPWIHWLFYNRHTILEWGHNYGFASRVSHLRSDSVGLLVYDGMCTYPEHRCYIIGPSGQRQPSWERVNILGIPYEIEYIYIYIFAYIMILYNERIFSRM